MLATQNTVKLISTIVVNTYVGRYLKEQPGAMTVVNVLVSYFIFFYSFYLSLWQWVNRSSSRFILVNYFDNNKLKSSANTTTVCFFRLFEVNF